MNKEEILTQVKELVARGELSRDEVWAAIGGTAPTAGAVKKSLHLDISKVLYGIGGLIVVAGIIFLIAQMWESFGAAEQILATLGSAMVIYISAVLLYQYDRIKLAATVLFTVAAALMPLGIGVTLHHLSPGGKVWLGQLLMAGIPAVIYLSSYRLFKQVILLMIAILFTTWSFYAVVGLMIDDSYLNPETQGKIWSYVTLAAGMIYLSLGWSMKGTLNDRIIPWLYLFGSAATLGAGYALTFWQEPWIVIYFGLVLAAFYISLAWRSRVMLVLSALALMAHLSHISFEYFANSLGWPLALIISGFLIIGIGYGTVILNQRFLKSSRT